MTNENEQLQIITERICFFLNEGEKSTAWTINVEAFKEAGTQ